MRITKDLLRKSRSELLNRLRELAALALPSGMLLAECPAINEAFQRQFPYRSPGQRPAFAAAALNELLYEAVTKSLPDRWLD